MRLRVATRRLCTAALACWTIVLNGSCARAPEPRARTTVRFATGTPGGGFFPVGERLAQAYARSMPDVTFDIQPSAGAVTNIEAIQRGDADLGLAFADVAYIAFTRRLNQASESYDQLRGIAVLQLTPVHLVVGGSNDIRRVTDLRGRRVGVGPPGSGTALTASLVLEAFGLDGSVVRTETLPFNEAARRLIDGTLDAMFDNAIFPAESVRMATRAGARPSINRQTGPQFGFATGIVSARVARLGGAITF